MPEMLTVTEPAAVRLLTAGRSRQVLGVFLRGENSVAAVARELGVDIRLVHREVLALLEAGLLRLVREQKRGGRPVKVYAAAASAFFVPFSATSAADLTELGGRRNQQFDQLFDLATTRKFAELHREQGRGREWGIRLYVDPDGQIQADTSYEGADLVGADVRYQGPIGLILDVRGEVQLSEAEAKEVQVELIKVLMRLRPKDLQHRQDGTGKPFLLRLGLVGVTEAEVQSLT